VLLGGGGGMVLGAAADGLSAADGNTPIGVES
jgi:hypothetical protein